MADTNASLTEHVAAYEPGEPVHMAAFLGGTPVFARDNGEVVLGEPAAARRVTAHADGSILCSATTGSHLLTGGDDGLIVRTGADGQAEILHDARGKWIDALAGRTDGALAWATGKAVCARDGKGGVRETAVATTARGLTFAPKGYRLAIAHYNGASLWFPNSEAPPEPYELEGLAPVRDLLAGRQVPRDGHAGKRPTRLASRRPRQHAHERLSEQSAVAGMVG